MDREEQEGFDSGGSVQVLRPQMVEVKYKTIDPYAGLPSIMRGPDNKIREKWKTTAD